MLVLTLLFALSGLTCTRPQPCLELTAREDTLRDHAIKQILPAFPPEAANANISGVAVAKVRINENGKLTSVDVVEAPHPSIAQATAEAIKQWEFKFYENSSTPECFNGKLTFYFVIEDGKAFVREPKRFQKT
jgi:TonB family protein